LGLLWGIAVGDFAVFAHASGRLPVLRMDLVPPAAGLRRFAVRYYGDIKI